MIVLPKPLRDRVVSELDKRLDFDIDEFLESPKLRLKLSPAELDKSLLELYDSISESPAGDIGRLIGGGGKVGMQNMYMRQQAQKELMRNGKFPEFFPPSLDPPVSDQDTSRTPTQWVQWAMRKNAPKSAEKKPKSTSNMRYGSPHYRPSSRPPRVLQSTYKHAFVPRQRSRTTSLLI